MTNRVWNGASADWFTAADWIAPGPSAVPGPGDTLTVASGTLELFGAEAPQVGTYDGATLLLGAATAAEAPTLLLSNAVTGAFFTIESGGSGSGFATLDIAGVVAIEGALLADAPGGVLTVDASAPGAALVLLHGGTLAVTGGDTLHVLGSIEAETTAVIDGDSTFVNDGIFAIRNAAITFAPGATLTGTGILAPGFSSSVTFLDNVVPATQTIDFQGPDGRLRIFDLPAFSGRIENFASGDLIDLTGITASGARYDPATHLLSVMQNTVTVTRLSILDGITGALETAPDGDGGSYIQFVGQKSRTAYEVAAGSVAMGADVVHATMTTPSGAPIDGTGIRIGILADSFGLDGQADAEAAAGYLPATAGGKSAVRVLKEGSDGADEGRAMAELIHQVAPGAQIDFYTAGGGQADFAAGVAALVADGANIIVDDWSFYGEPFYQVSGVVDAAVQNAIAAGVSYFTAAGNYGAAWFEAAWNPMTTTLAGVTGTVAAMRFDNATPYQTVSLRCGYTTDLTLQWDAAFPTNSSVAGSLAAVLYDLSGNVVAVSTQLRSPGGLAEPAIQIAVTPGGSVGTTDYRLAVYRVPGTPEVGQFKYILFGNSPGSTPGGLIDDPAAATGSGTVAGHALVPGVNVVGAVQWPNSPAFGQAPLATESFSSIGPGVLLFDANGNRLATPVGAGAVTILAPDGAASVVPALDGVFYGTSAAVPNAAAVAALMLQANPALTPSQVTADLVSTAVATPGLPAAAQGAGLIQAEAAVRAALGQTNGPVVACYAGGTRLRTPDGERRIDDLRRGDRVVTASGAIRPVLWVGRRFLDGSRHADPALVAPVRIAASAFAPGVPSRDLVLSPDHAVWWEGVLIPVRLLVNGATIVRDPVGCITYWHVELDRHDLVLAEGLAAESYLDTGNRPAFEGGGPALALHPDFARLAWAAGACAPHCAHGPALRAARTALLARALTLGHALTSNPMLRVHAGGRALHPRSCRETHVFPIPDSAGSLRILSRTHVPAEIDPSSEDRRTLGVQVLGIALDGSAVEAGEGRIGQGWHRAEPRGRWTDGDATLACAGARRLELRLDGGGRYWAAKALPRLKRAGA